MAMAAKTLAETVYFYPRNAMLTTDTSIKRAHERRTKEPPEIPLSSVLHYRTANIS